MCVFTVSVFVEHRKTVGRVCCHGYRRRRLDWGGKQCFFFFLTRSRPTDSPLPPSPQRGHRRLHRRQPRLHGVVLGAQVGILGAQAGQLAPRGARAAGRGGRRRVWQRGCRGRHHHSGASCPPFGHDVVVGAEKLEARHEGVVARRRGRRRRVAAAARGGRARARAVVGALTGEGVFHEGGALRAWAEGGGFRGEEGGVFA